MLNGWIAAGLFAMLLGSARISFLPKPFCSCDDMPPVESAFQYSDLVVRGQITGIDTVEINSGYTRDKNGTKAGRHNYSPDFVKYVRVTLRVTANFKSSLPLPDTIYILTPSDLTACGYPFPFYIGPEYVQAAAYDYIIYGHKWTDYSITTWLHRKKNRSMIKTSISSNTFVTSRCMRTRPANAEELQKLNQLKY